MARKTRKRRHAKRRNPSIKVYRRRHAAVANPRRRRRHTRRASRRRNPMVSAGGGSAMVKSVAGGLIGVTLTKMVSGMVSGFVPGSGAPLMKAIVSAVSAWGVGKIISGVDPNFGAAAAFGGYMQAGSDALNAFAPSLGSQFGLRGLGAFVPSSFTVPENPIMRGMAIPAPAPQSGIGSFLARRF